MEKKEGPFLLFCSVCLRMTDLLLCPVLNSPRARRVMLPCFPFLPVSVSVLWGRMVSIVGLREKRECLKGEGLFSDVERKREICTRRRRVERKREK